MKLLKATTPHEVAKLIGARCVGDDAIPVLGINEIHLVEDGDIAFVDHPKYYEKTLASSATVIIIDKEVDCPSGKALLVHPTPFDAFNQLTRHFLKAHEAQRNPTPKIHSNAIVHPGAHIGKYVEIGANSEIHPGVVIYDHTVIGERVIIHANSVIGSDGFYYKRKQDRHEKLQGVGRVVLEDDVEIGAGCTLDRGVTGDTRVGRGTKMDNQVHIGHDTTIGARCLFAAQVGIAGCVQIGDGVVIWGQVGCAANVKIGDGAVVYAQSGIGRSIPAGQTYFGSPAMEARTKLREIATLSRLARPE